MKHYFPLAIVVLLLLFVSLACQSPLDLPTPDPAETTPAPTSRARIDEHTPVPGDDATPAPPPVEVTRDPNLIVLTGPAVKTSYASNAQGCDVPTTGTLTVNPNGTAQLVSTSPVIIDHYNCTQSNDETWYLDGTVNDFSQTATFTSCNFGGFSARGTITYANQTLLGTVSCFYKDGTQAIMLVFGN